MWFRGTDEGDPDDTLLLGLEFSAVDVYGLGVSEDQVVRDATTSRGEELLSRAGRRGTSVRQAHG
jgi:hypothetical protein